MTSVRNSEILAFGAVADELYGLSPRNFVAVRDTRAADARRSGDRSLAAEIKALRRPTTSAWLANCLVRERDDDIGRLLELGAAMREAQTLLAGEDLRQLSRRRHQTVRALSGEARRLASDAGTTVSEDVVRELEGTLEAALADAAAGEVLRAGRLTTALDYSGFAPVDLDGAVATAAAKEPAKDEAAPEVVHDEVDARRRRRRKDVAADEKSAAEKSAAEQRSRQVAAAVEALHAAQVFARDAERNATECARLVEGAERHRERLRQSISDLESRLDALREEDTEATRQLLDAQNTLDGAEREAGAAGARVAKEQRNVDRLRT